MVNGDVLDETNEKFVVNLSNPSNATFSDSAGVGTITDDDPLPALAIGDATMTEGDARHRQRDVHRQAHARSGRRRRRSNTPRPTARATAGADYGASGTR